MQEYSSVAVSTYKAGDLPGLLNEQSAEGWSVVSIVTAGTDVIAYLTRNSPGSHSGTAGGPGDDIHAPGSEADAPSDDRPGSAAAATAVAAAATAADAASDAADATAAEAADSVDEPAGWAAAPYNAAADAGGTADAAVDAAADAGGTTAANPMPDSVAGTAAAAVPAAAVPAAAAAPAPESTVPAGWYADPSGRFELRYWDGSAWTEHVSRSGQQFTDPPVA